MWKDEDQYEVSHELFAKIFFSSYYQELLNVELKVKEWSILEMGTCIWVILIIGAFIL